jgi:hypothetical protein
VGAPDADTGQLNAGRLSYGSSNLTGDWPYTGGTGLGTIGQVFLFPQRMWKALDAEETNSAVEVLWLGGNVTVALTMVGWDEAGVAALNPNTGTSNSKTIIEWPGSDYTAGAPITPLTNVVFTPHDTTNGKGWVLYKAVAVPDVNQELACTAGRFLEIPAVLIAIPDATDRLGKFGKFSELSL